MKVAMTLVAAMAIAAPVRAQHIHEQAPPAAAPQHIHEQAPPAQAPAAPGPGQRGPQTPPIDVPWNDAIPAGTVDHAAKALKDSPRHGEWVDIKMADGTALKHNRPATTALSVRIFIGHLETTVHPSGAVTWKVNTPFRSGCSKVVYTRRASGTSNCV